YYEFLLRTVAKAHGLDLARPFGTFSDAEQALLLHGTSARASYTVEIERGSASFQLEERFTAAWPGLCGHVDAWHAKSEAPEWRAILERHMQPTTCAECEGERLAPAPRAVTLGKKRLPEALALSVGAAVEWLAALELPPAARTAIAPVL